MKNRFPKLNKKILALYLDGDLITLSYVELEKEKIKLREIKTVSLLGVEEKDKGKKLSEELKDILQNFSPTNREVLIIVHSFYLGRYALPDISPKEVPQALRWQFKGVVSEGEENIIFDYLPVKETTDAEGLKQKHYLVCLAPKREIEKILEIVERLKLEPVKITVSPFSLSNLLPQEPQKIYALLDFSWTTSFFSFYQNGQLIFSRIIPVGVKNLINSLGVSIAYKGTHLSLTPEKAWQALSEVGIPEGFTEGEWQGFPLSQLLVLMRPELERLSLEIIRSLEYFSFTLKEGNIGKIFIAGIGASLKGIIKFLSQSLNRHIELLDYPIETNLRLSFTEKFLSYYPLGSLLNISNKIDLLPQEYKFIKIPSFKKAINITSFLLLMITLSSFSSTIPKYLFYKKELSLYKKQASNLERVKKIKNEIQQKEIVLAELIKEKINFLWIAQEVSSILPPQTMLGKLDIAKGKKDIELVGIVFAKEFVENTVAEIMKNIENSKLLKEPKLEWINKKLGEEKAEFKITAKLK